MNILIRPLGRRSNLSGQIWIKKRLLDIRMGTGWQGVEFGVRERDSDTAVRQG